MLGFDSFTINVIPVRYVVKINSTADLPHYLHTHSLVNRISRNWSR